MAARKKQGFGNRLANGGFASPLTTNSRSKNENWPSVANVERPNVRDPLGVVPRVNKNYARKGDG